MSTTVCLRAAFLLLVALVLVGPGHARACSATAQDAFVVGNTATDGACNYSTIQAAVDAATCPAGTRIFLTDEVAYSAQHVSINNKNVSLIGRAAGAHCGTLSAVCGTLFPCPTAPLQTIHGNIKIRGTSNVTIQYLTITGGTGVADSNGTTYGGGIDYAATGELHIDTSTIEDNTAYNGGGIRFQGYGGSADLYLHRHTLIDGNTATNGGSGGGIRVEGDATLHADESNIWIHDNIAADKGGGIAIVGPAAAHIGSAGDAFFGSPVGVVSYNTANHGGGIAVIAEHTGAADVELYPTDPNHPVRIEHNRAHNTGGGLYAIGYFNLAAGYSSAADVYIGGAQLDANKAPEGSGIYADSDSTKGSYLYFYPGHCAAGIECTTISNNLAVDDGDNATAGSALLIQTYGSLQAQQFVMRGNQGAHAIRAVDSLDGPMVIDTCLLAGNVMTGELITTGNATATFSQCTFAYNSIGGASVLRVAPTFTLTNSIFAQGPLRSIYSTSATPNLTLDYLMSLETDSLSAAAPHLYADDPSFVDAAHGDFHLRAYSLAIDVAPAGARDNDVENRLRDLDMPNIPNLDGPADLGAYERQSPFDCGISDTVFCSGFE